MSEAVEAKHTPLDVITIGRASVDLYGQQIGSRLEDITSFAKSVGGCPANISVGTARLGLRSALLGAFDRATQEAWARLASTVDEQRAARVLPAIASRQPSMTH